MNLYHLLVTSILHQFLTNLTPVSSHVRFLCPPPRSCFYGIDPGNSNSDGIWRKKPCGHSPVSPDTTVTSGTSLCLRVYEFVPHEGYFTISISPEAIGPNDNDDSFIPLLSNYDDPTDNTEDTGIQSFMITIPDDLTCDHCTIQIAQYSEDLDWYYYTCTDIRVVNATVMNDMNDGLNMTTDGLIEGDLCYETNEYESDWSEECVWKEEEGLIRIMILQDIILGSVGLFNTLIFIGMLLYVTKCCKRCKFCDKICNKCGKDSNNVGDVEDKISNKEECCDIVWKRYWKLWIGVIVFIVINFTVTGIIIVMLKECEIADDYGDVTV